MKAGYLSLHLPDRSLRVLLAAFFLLFISFVLPHSLLANTGPNESPETVEDALVSPPNDLLNPPAGKRVELIYRGLKGLLPARLDIPNPESVEKVFIEVVYKGSLPGTQLHGAIQARLSNGTEVTLQPSIIKGNWGGNGVGAFYATVGKTSRVQLDFEVQENSAQSVLLYVLRNDGDQGKKQSGIFANIYGYQTTANFRLPIPANGNKKDIEVTIPVTEITADARVLDFEITAGNQTKRFRRNWPYNYRFRNECCIDTVTSFLQAVEGDVSEVVVKVISPRNGPPNGQSFVISGLVTASMSSSCVALEVDLPKDICTDNTVVLTAKNPGNGYTATWDFGPESHPRTTTGFGTKYLMFSKPGRQEITVKIDGPDCSSTEVFYVDVEECNQSQCALENAYVIQHPAHGNNDGIIELNMCVRCGSTPPYRVFYTYQGRQYEVGPLNQTSPRLVGLSAGTYSNLYVIDANGCQTNVGPPVTLCNGGCDKQPVCPEATCVLTGFLDNGRKRALWLPRLGFSDPRWRWEDGTGELTVTTDRDAVITGRVVSIEDPSCGLIVNMVLRKRRNWSDWSALGRDWKGSRGRVNNNQHTTWDFYELVGNQSTLTGFGCWSGTLSLEPRPADYRYGVQVGEGANDQNLAPGISAWFAYDGRLSGQNFAGEGDINVEGVCRLSDLQADPTPILSCPDDYAVSCGGSPDDAPKPEVNCGNPEDYTITFEDREVSANPRRIERTYTAQGPGGPATCVQMITFGDDSPPVFTKVPTAAEMTCGEVRDQTAEAEDDCGPVDITFRETRFNEQCLGSYNLRRVWTATDESGNTATAEIVVRVRDEEGPTFTSGPEDIVIECKEDLPTDQPTAEDNCGGRVDLDYSVTDCQAALPIYAWEDGKLVYITERRDPSLRYQSGMKQLVLTSMCSDDPSSRSRWRVRNPNAYPVYVTKVMAYGKQSYGGFVVPANTDVFFFTRNEGGANTTIVHWEDEQGTERNTRKAAGTAKCDLSPAETCTCVYERRWVASDDCGNKTTFVQKVWQRDTRAPTLQNIPADRVYQAGTALPPATGVTASDACGTATVSLNEYTIPSSEYTCDEAAVYFLYGYEAAHLPVLSLGNRSLRLDDEALRLQVRCDGTALLTGTLVDAADSRSTYDVNLIFENRQTFAQYSAGGGTATTSCNAADKSTWLFYSLRENGSRITGQGEAAGLSVTLRPRGNTVFQLGAGANQRNCQNGFLGEFNLTATGGSVGGSRGTLRASGAVVNFNETERCEDNFTVVRVYSAVDACGNRRILRQALRVIDNKAPTFSVVPQNKTIQCDQPIPSDRPQVTDQGDDDVELTVEETTTGDDCNKRIRRVWTATDDCGNAKTAVQVITIQDTKAPSITLSGGGLPGLGNGDLLVVSCGESINFNEANATAVDNCDPNPSVTFSDELVGSGDCADDGYRVRLRCTWTATDRCGNKRSLQIFIEITDDENPTLTQIPADLTQSCAQALPTDQPVVSDNCSSNPVITERQQTVPGDCADSYQVLRIWTVTDECGNTTTAQQRVTITDDVAPVFSGVPAAITLSCEEAIPTDQPTATDDCDNEVRIVETSTRTDGSCADSYTLTRQWRAIDNCGNARTASQVVTVTDTKAPTISFTNPLLNNLNDGDELVVACSDVPVLSESDVRASDNCDTDVDVVFRDQLTSVGNCATDGYVQLFACSWTATDNCGNTTTLNIRIKVTDEEDPSVIGVPEAIAISCDQQLPTSQPTFSDNCSAGADLVVVETSQRRDGACADAYEVVRTWVATDACGNAATVSQVVTVSDDQAPVLVSIPKSTSISCDEAIPTTLPTATDNCDADVQVTVRDTRRDGNCADSYRVVRVFTATDNCGNTATASQVVNVSDKTPPVLANVPADVSISCDITFSPDAPTASDNCDDNVDITEKTTRQEGDCPDSYLLIRTWVATDNCGNSASASQTVTVSDDTPPVFGALPQNTSIACDADLPTNRPTATDDCDLDVNVAETQNIVAGACANSYTVIRTFIATDNCGNSVSATQEVTVTDDSAPSFAGVPAAITISCAATVPVAQPTANDNCDGQVAVTEAQTTRNQTCGGSYEVVRTWTATDKCGNTATTSQLVTVVDDTAPSFAFVPANLSLSCAEALPTDVATATDDCDQNVAVTEQQNRVDGSCADSYRVVRLFTATDHCGNTATASQVVTFSDDVAPSFAGVPQNTSISCEDPLPTDAPTASDDCNTEVTITANERRRDGTCSDSYRIIRTWTATDNCGNSSTTRQVVTVQDQTAPSFTSVPAAVTISCSESLPTTAATATDNCDDDVDVIETQRTEPGACANAYRVIRVWTATDNCGNALTASQVVTVEDKVAPTFAGVPAALTIACDAPLPSVGPNVSDNCDTDVVVNETQTTQPGGCADSYTVVRLWTATDACGNTATASQVVTVEDKSSPSFSFVPQAVTISCDDALPAEQPTAGDNCDATVTLTEAQQTTPGTCANAYAVIRTWTATDNCGNTATASQVVTVEDQTAPVFANVPQPLTLECDQPMPTSEPIASDNCDQAVTITEAQVTTPSNCAGAFSVLRTWTAVDACGNSATASQIVTFEDSKVPSFTQVPAAVTLSCEADLPTVLAKAQDNCDQDVTVTVAEQSTPGTCGGARTVVRTFTATDDCGNTASASQVVTFQDSTEPSFVGVPAMVTIACDADLPTNAPTATDNCDVDVTITEAQTTLPGPCTDSYQVVRTWTATDACGNTATTSQVVNVEDNKAPGFTSVPTPISIACDEDLPTTMATAADSCDTEVIVTVTDRTEPGTCPDSYTVIRMFTAVDNCGNTATAEQRVTVTDRKAPAFTSVPQAVTIGCADDLPTTQALANDNCDGNVTVSETQSTTPGNCTDSYTVTRLFTATDDCGNTASASQVVTVVDQAAPTFVGVPTALTQSCEQALPTTAPTATDNCDTQVDIQESVATVAGDCANASVVIRTWTATDNCGNTATAEQRITLEDKTPPTLTSVPSDVTIACDQPVPTDLPVGTDNCDDDVTVTVSDAKQAGDCAGSYTLVRTFTATDNCGNTVTASQTIQVEDQGAPSLIDIPAAVSISCEMDLPTDAPTATDACDDNVVVTEAQQFIAGDCGGDYRVVRVWTATDDCGNTASGSQVVSVQDNTPPELADVPADIAITCGELVPSGMPSATDNCDNDVHLAETQQRLPGGCADSYTLIRTFTATDDCGNTASASQTVTVSDAGAPVLAGVPAAVSLSCDADLPTDAPTATDDCDDDVVITEAQTRIDGDCPSNYQVVRTWTASDDCGNTASASQVVTVTDQAAPTFTNVPATVTVACDEALPTDQPEAVDNCDANVSITEASTQESGACRDSYVVIRTWTATDDCGNVATTSQRVVVEDQQAPTFASIPPAVTISCDQDFPTAQARATDNCDTDVTITETTDRDRGQCADGGTVTRIWTATDNCGNTATASQLVTIVDDVAPVFADVPASLTIQCDEALPDDAPTATDNCDLEVVVRAQVDRVEGPCSDSYEVIRTWTATDDCGNTATASQTISVIDPGAPVFTQVPPAVTITCEENLPTSLPIATDNCDTDVSITETQETLPGPCPDSYEVVRTWIASDNCGNTARATQLVSVIDMGTPAFTSVPASRTVNCDEDPGDEDPVAVDNCDSEVALTMTETTNGDDCAAGITVTRIWTATDNCGNTASTSQVITFIDQEPPVLADLARTLTVSCDQPVPLEFPTATDNCDRDVAITYFDNEEDKPCGSTITRTWVATDDCGNSASGRQLIVINDEVPPVLVGVPASTQLNCDGTAPPANVTATDNCTPDIVVRYSEFTAPGRCPGEQKITRVWAASDECGNVATASQVVTLSDGGVPVFANVPASVTISCADALPTTRPTATDDCGGNAAVDVTEEQEIQAGNCAGNYRVVRTFSASDDCGNVATTSQVVTVTDDVAPTFVEVPASATIWCNEEVPQAEARATDNCDNDVNVTVVERTVAGECEDNQEVLRVWTATDDCGNTATASQVITIIDRNAPVLTSVPRNVTIPCGAELPSGSPTATDDCDMDVDVSLVETREPGNRPGQTRVIRTWTATDNCGNTSTASQVITVKEGGDPVFTFVPADLQLSCRENLPDADARATDACDGEVTVTREERRKDGKCAANYTLTRTWTATDQDGNSATASQKITVSDTEAPSFALVPAEVTLPCGAAAPTDVALADDNCDNEVQVTVDESRRDGGCGNAYTLVRTFTATDDCGNTATASQIVNFVDDQAPEFTFVPASEEYQCTLGQPQQPAKATDNCSDKVDITFEDVSPTADCSERLQRIWKATDACGNTATAIQQILLEDTEKPSLSGIPANATVDLDNGGSLPAPANVTATDNCDPAPVVQLEETSTPTGACGYVLERTWTATDRCGNSARGTQRLTVTGGGSLGIRVEPSSDCAPTGITVKAVPADPASNYAWTASAGSFSDVSAAVTTFIPPRTGVFTLNLSASGSGCPGTASTTVTINTPTLSVSNDGPACAGDDVVLSASPGANRYTWSGPNGYAASGETATIRNASSTAGGRYTVTAYYDDCQQTSSTTVVISTGGTLTVDTPKLACAGGAVTLIVDAGAGAQWTGPDGTTYTGSSVTVDPVTYANANGNWSVSSSGACAGQAAFSLKVVDSPELSISEVAPVCPGESFTLNVSGATNYTWTGPAGFTASGATATVTVDASQSPGAYTYTAVGTDLAGCTANAAITVIVKDGCDGSGGPCIAKNSIVRARELEVCMSGNQAALGIVTVTTPVVPTGFSCTYLLAEVDGEQVIRNSKTGEFIVTDEGAYSIHQFIYDTLTFGTLSITPDLTVSSIEKQLISGGGELCGALTVYGARTTAAACCVVPELVNLTTVDAGCNTPTGSASLDVVGNPADYLYTWTPDLGAVQGQDGNRRGGLPAGNYAVRVVNRADASCFSDFNFAIGVDELNAGLPTITAATCGSADGTVSFVGGATGLQYAWSDGGSGAVRNGLAAGDYTVTVTDAQASCSEAIAVSVGASADFALRAEINRQPDCDQANGEVQIFSAGGSGQFEYSWGASATRSNLTSGLYTVTVTDRQSGCQDSITFTLRNAVTAAATVTVDDVALTCNGAANGTPTFDVDYPDDFRFPPVVTFVDSRGEDATFGAFGPGDYCILVRDAEGCLAGSACFSVTEPEPLRVNATVTQSGCDDDGAIALNLVGGTPPYSYDWTHLPAANDPRDVSDLPQGQYSVRITDANGCVARVNSISIAKQCGCSPTLPTVVNTPIEVCLVDNQVTVGAQVTAASPDAGFATAYLFADAAGTVLSLNTAPVFQATATGDFTIHALVYNPQAFSLASITTGTTKLVDLNLQFVQGGGFICAGLDLTGTRIHVETCPGCDAEVGALSTDSPAIWCTDDGLPSVLALDLTASRGTVGYLIVDQAGIIVRVDASANVDIEGIDEGLYTIYALAVGANTTLPVAGTSLLPLGGCYDLSNGLSVTALTGADCDANCQVNGGSITALTPQVLCLTDLPATVAVTSTGLTGPESAYVITDADGVILVIQPLDGALDVNALPVGRYSVYTLAYEQLLRGLDVDANVSQLDGCYDLSRPQNLDVAAGAGCGASLQTDTLRITVSTGETEEGCFLLDPGFSVSQTTYSLGAASASGQSGFGTWVLLPSGCVAYTAGTTTGVDVETLVLVATDGAQTDTTIVLVTITDGVPSTETVPLTVGVGNSATACPVRVPQGFTNITAAVQRSTPSRYGAFTVNADNGCLTFAAGQLSGADVDTITVFVCDASLNRCHTVSYVISVLPEGDAITRNVLQGDTLVLCAPEALLFGTAQTPSLCGGPDEGNAVFDAATRCFVYTAPTNYLGAVSLCIEVCDDDGVCVRRDVSINVLPACADFLADAAAGVVATDCDGTGAYCLPIANAQIADYALTLDGRPYRNTAQACAGGGTTILVDTGIHLLVVEELSTNCTDTVRISVSCQDCGLSSTASFIDVDDCADRANLTLNLLPGNWGQYEFTLDGADATGLLVANGTLTQVSVDTGAHTLIVRALDGSCLEVIETVVRCSGRTTPGGDTTLTRTVRVSFTDSICLDAFNLDLTGTVTTVTETCPGAGNGGVADLVFDADTQCLQYTGLVAGTDTLCLEICTADGCVDATLVVRVVPPAASMEDVTLPVGTTGTFCIDTSELASPITEVFNFCANSSGGAVDFDLDEDTYCVTFSAVSVGTEQGCYVLCNAVACDTVYLNVTAIPGNTNVPPVAVDDAGMTTKGNPVDINVLANDTLNGELEQIFPISLPSNGSIFFRSDSLVEYSPDPEFCGAIDSFSYAITNGIAFDTANVRIEVTCDDLVIFSGFSPNGDGVNDLWKVLGIEAFPDNRVLIFNRWGNEVFQRSGYDNSEEKGFTGRFGNKTLPDGTYFYVIDLGAAGCRSGYVQIMR